MLNLTLETNGNDESACPKPINRGREARFFLNQHVRKPKRCFRFNGEFEEGQEEIETASGINGIVVFLQLDNGFISKCLINIFLGLHVSTVLRSDQGVCGKIIDAICAQFQEEWEVKKNRLSAFQDRFGGAIVIEETVIQPAVLETQPGNKSKADVLSEIR